MIVYRYGAYVSGPQILLAFVTRHTVNEHAVSISEQVCISHFPFLGQDSLAAIHAACSMPTDTYLR